MITTVRLRLSRPGETDHCHAVVFLEIANR